MMISLLATFTSSDEIVRIPCEDAHVHHHDGYTEIMIRPESAVEAGALYLLTTASPDEDNKRLRLYHKFTLHSAGGTLLEYIDLSAPSTIN